MNTWPKERCFASRYTQHISTYHLPTNSPRYCTHFLGKFSERWDDIEGPVYVRDPLKMFTNHRANFAYNYSIHPHAPPTERWTKLLEPFEDNMRWLSRLCDNHNQRTRGDARIVPSGGREEVPQGRAQRTINSPICVNWKLDVFLMSWDLASSCSVAQNATTGAPRRHK